MKTNNASKLAIVKQLAEVIELRKVNDKLEKELKAQVKQMMGDNMAIEAGDYMIVRKERSRKDLNKDAIMHDHGLDFFKKYEETSSYEIMEVITKKVAVNE